MTEKADKTQEALQDAEKPAIPPPAYQEISSTFVESDGFEMVETPEKSQTAGPSATAMDTKPVETMPMTDEKGPEHPPRPSAPIPDADEILPLHEKEVITALPAMPPADEERDAITALPPIPPAEEGNRSLQVHFDGQQEEAPPTLPRRPSGVRFSEDFSHESTQFNLAPPILPAPLDASGRAPLKYTFEWTRPLLDFPSLDITPADNAVLQSASPAVPSTGFWRMNYHKKYHARLHRYTATQNGHNRNTAQVGGYPFRQIAEIKFPEFIIPGVGCGATVKFDIHEEEVARLSNQATARGKKPLPRVQKFMQCEGWLTTSYTMEVPVLDHRQTTWKTIPRPKTTKAGPGPVDTTNETAIVERKTTDNEREAKKQNIKLVTIHDMIETAKRTLNDATWTPYAPQELVVESDGVVVATYQRASPFAKHAGVLTINQPAAGHVGSLPEYIEGIIIAATSMVGMQDRIGLASGLMEAASTSTKWSQEQWLRVQREWKDRKAKRQSTSTHPYGNAAARRRSAYKGGEVGSEIFDDGLGGAITVDEREAARREQIAWDESVKARAAGVDDGLAGVLSADEMEAARREHLAWEERSTANALGGSVPGHQPGQDTSVWDEKPKFVYA